jgi:hypothetical protein
MGIPPSPNPDSQRETHNQFPTRQRHPETQNNHKTTTKSIQTAPVESETPLPAPLTPSYPPSYSSGNSQFLRLLPATPTRS